MYLVKYILLNIVYHSYTYSLLSVLRMSGNKQFVKTHACLSFIRRNRCTARNR